MIITCMVIPQLNCNTASMIEIVCRIIINETKFDRVIDAFMIGGNTFKMSFKH